MRRGRTGLPQPEPRRCIPEMPAGAPTAAARRQKKGASPFLGGPERGGAPSGTTGPTPPRYSHRPPRLTGQGRPLGRGVGRRGTEGERDTAAEDAKPSAVFW